MKTQLNKCFFQVFSIILMALLAISLSTVAQKASNSNELIETVKNGFLKETDSLLTLGANVNSTDQSKLTPLMFAAKSGYYEIADLLIKKGAKVNMTDIDKWSALMIASGNGQVKIIELLLLHGAKINQKDKDSMTSLMIACNYGQEDAVVMLLQKGAKVNYKSVIRYSKQVIGQKSDGKGNITYITGKSIGEGGWTALHLAAGTGNKEIAGILIDYKANINARDAKNKTPAGMAMKYKHPEVAEYIKSRGGTE